MEAILSNASVSITELKRNPSAVIEAADGESVAVLVHNKPSAYLVPAETYQRLMERLGLTQADFAVIELNEAFASQGLATLRQLGIADDDPRVNRNGGAIALGHPLGMSGARITGTAALELAAPGERSLSTMCIGVGQGIAIALEKV